MMMLSGKFIMAPFSIASVNVNGLKNKQKRLQVFNFLKNSKYDIICLQETHQTSEEKRRWANEWSAKSAWCYRSGGAGTSTCGVGILFRKHLNLDVIETRRRITREGF